jgi:4-amino-4-deoxy-L-arabinose transferase-like glycosyltransferase
MAREIRSLAREWATRCGLTAPWSRVILPLAVSTALLSFNFGTRVFATYDEARFPMLARDIRSAGDWLLQHFDGVPHLNKPPK